MVCVNYAAGRDNLTRSQVRGLLEFFIRTDAELDAFCLDYFPTVKRNFSAGMSRLQKINLFLEQAELIEIDQCIRETFTDLNVDQALDSEATSNVQRRITCHDASVLTIFARFTRALGQPLWCVAFMETLAIILLGWIVLRTEPIKTTNVAQSNSRSMEQEPRSFGTTIDTQPTDALIFDAESGMMLGRSPWMVWQRAMRPQRNLCIWHADYLPEHIVLSPKDMEKTLLLVRLRPKVKPIHSKGHSGETNKAENCLAKTPLVE